MKTYFLLFFTLFLFSTNAQSVEENIDQLKLLVENESYMEALGFADKLIANKVKEGLQGHAGQVYLLRGITKYELELEEDAIIDLKVSQSLDNSNYISYFYIADIYYHMSSYSSALENIIYFLEKRPSDIDGLVVKSKCELELSNPYAAKITIQKALALRSSDAELYFIRAVINGQLGEDKLACKDMRIAAKFGFEPASKRVEDTCAK